MKGITAVLMVAAMAAAPRAHAAATVYVDGTSDAPISNRLLYQVREGIRRSASMALAPSDQRAGYVVRMVALDNPESTAYSFVLTTRASLLKDGGELILEYRVGVCGSNRVASCADNIVAVTDTVITERVSVLQPLIDEVFASPTSTQADP